MDISEEHDNERVAIRKELSNMTFEQLQKLKEEMGTKLFNKKVFNKTTSITKDTKETSLETKFKRENKNRPREISSKVQVRHKEIQPIIPIQKNIPRDPRFDNLCGTFKEKAFHSAYRFVDTMREEELLKLKKSLRKEKDPEEKVKLKYLIQRMENQCREAKIRQEKEEKEREERAEKIKALKRGERPVYRKKSDQTILDLVEKYETLTKTGRINKYLEKKTKQLKAKERKHTKF